MGLVRVISHNLTKDVKKTIKEFDNFRAAAIYGRSLEDYLKKTNKGYEETFGFASICYAIGPQGDKYQFYYELTELWKQ